VDCKEIDKLMANLWPTDAASPVDKAWDIHERCCGQTGHFPQLIICPNIISAGYKPYSGLIHSPNN
jgi:hypothetical protein